MRGWTVSGANSQPSPVITRKTGPASPPPQRPPGDGHEEPIDPRGGAEPVPRGGVGTERGGDRRVQGHKAYPVELRVPDGDHALGEVDVGAGQRRRLPQAHARRCQQPEQRPIGGRPQRWLQPLGRDAVSGDLARRVDVGRWVAGAGPPAARAAGPRGGVDGVQVAGEAAYLLSRKLAVIGLIPTGRRAQVTASSTVTVSAPLAAA